MTAIPSRPTVLDATALAIAECHDGLLATDDGRARHPARGRGCRFTGSIGVLVELVDDADYRAPSRDFSDYL